MRVTNVAAAMKNPMTPTWIGCRLSELSASIPIFQAVFGLVGGSGEREGRSVLFSADSAESRSVPSLTPAACGISPGPAALNGRPWTPAAVLPAAGFVGTSANPRAFSRVASPPSGVTRSRATRNYLAL